MTAATLTVTPEFVTLRIRFPDGVIRIMESRQQFKLTTSSPMLLTALKTNEPIHQAYYALYGIKTANLSQETSLMKMERLRVVAEQSACLIEFVRNAGFWEIPMIFMFEFDERQYSVKFFRIGLPSEVKAWSERLGRWMTRWHSFSRRDPSLTVRKVIDLAIHMREAKLAFEPRFPLMD